MRTLRKLPITYPLNVFRDGWIFFDNTKPFWSSSKHSLINGKWTPDRPDAKAIEIHSCPLLVPVVCIDDVPPEERIVQVGPLVD